MRAVIQRVSEAVVRVDGAVVGAIYPPRGGLLVFLGCGQGDTAADVAWLVSKVTKLRVFEDAQGRMSESLLEVSGQALVVSQFTLYGSLKKGSRPSFSRAAEPGLAEPLYQQFIADLALGLGRPVATGQFGAQMEVDAKNEGPVTLVLDSRLRDF